MTQPVYDNSTQFRKIRIILADDHPLIRQATRMLLEKQQDLEVVAETSDGRETVEIAKRLKPDIIIMDIRMPSINGIEATKRIKLLFPNTKILVLSVYTDIEHMRHVAEAGASGYITKDVSGEEIIHAIRSIVNGEKLFPSSYKTAYHIRGDLREESKGLEKLNTREITILHLVAIGMSNKGISTQLGISLRMVKAHLTTIFLKLGVKSRTEAIAVGLKLHLLTVEDINIER